MTTIERYRSLIAACHSYEENNGGSIVLNKDGRAYEYSTEHVQGSNNAKKLFQHINADIHNYAQVARKFHPNSLQEITKVLDTIYAKHSERVDQLQFSCVGTLCLMFIKIFGSATNNFYNSIKVQSDKFAGIHNEVKNHRAISDIGKINEKLSHTFEAANRDLSTKECKNVDFLANPKVDLPSFNEKDFTAQTIGDIQFHAHSLMTTQKRKTPDDRYFAFTLQLPGASTQSSVIGVCDGYNGPHAAEFVKVNLQRTLTDEFSKTFAAQNRHPIDSAEHKSLALWNGLKETAVKLHEDYITSAKGDRKKQGVGTTLTLVLIDVEDVWTANTGDSTAIKINKEKVERLGEEATNDPSNARFVNPVMDRGGVSEKGQGIWLLGTCRSIGNEFADEEGNTPLPKITKSKFDGDIVIASDGLWKVCSPLELQKVAQNGIHERFSAELALRARAHGSADDITVMTVSKVKN